MLNNILIINLIQESGRIIDTYNLVGPGGNNCSTISYKALRAGGANVGAWQSPADVNRYFHGGNLFFK
jgi:hypothetical protein